MAEQKSVQDLEDRVKALETLLGETLTFIQRLADIAENTPTAPQSKTSFLLSDARSLADRARQAGVHVDYR